MPRFFPKQKVILSRQIAKVLKNPLQTHGNMAPRTCRLWQRIVSYIGARSRIKSKTKTNCDLFTHVFPRLASTLWTYEWSLAFGLVLHTFCTHFARILHAFYALVGAAIPLTGTVRHSTEDRSNYNYYQLLVPAENLIVRSPYWLMHIRCTSTRSGVFSQHSVWWNWLSVKSSSNTWTSIFHTTELKCFL